MQFPEPSKDYSPSNEGRFRSLVGQAMDKQRSAEKDVEIARDQKLIMRSPNGTRWAITVDNAGALSAAVVA